MNEQPLTFNQLETHIQKLYHQGDYVAVLELADRFVSQFPKHKTVLEYWRICMAARLGQDKRALQLLQQVLQAGIWYSEVLLRKSPSLAGLQGKGEFERLVKHNHELQQEDQAQQFPLLTLHEQGACLPGGPACPLLIGMHANSGNAQDSLGFWQPAARAGWLVGAPQSSQAMWKNAYMWDDRETALREIRRHFNALQRKFNINPDQVILGGHSMGGELAAWLSLKRIIPARGFICFGPGGPLMDDPDEWQPLIDEALLRLEQDNSSLRGYLVAGADDNSIFHDALHAFQRMLNAAGIQTELDIIPGAGHDFQPEYEEALLLGLDYLSGE